MTFYTNITQWFDVKFKRWLVKRVPKASKQVLTSRNIFIFPSRFGFAFLFFVLLLFILGTNYQNNLIILLSYLFISVFITAMLQSFNNMSQLTISVTAMKLSGFSGAELNIPIRLYSNKERLAYQLFFQANNTIELHSFSGEQTSLIPFTLTSRGRKQLPRLTLQSYFGFGLFRCWTKVDLNITVLVYPKPECPLHINIEHYLSTNDNDVDDTLSEHMTAIRSGVDEFNELVPYQQGESLAKVAWKQVARGQGWYTKNYDQLINNTPKWLSLSTLPNAPIEQQLRWLSYLIVECQKHDKTFGLKLTTSVVMPYHGREHSHNCLKEIALYGQ